MTETIYIVMGEASDYEEQYEWPAAAFTDKARAEERCADLNAAATDFRTNLPEADVYKSPSWVKHELDRGLGFHKYLRTQKYTMLEFILDR